MWPQKAKKDGKQRILSVSTMLQLNVDSGARMPWTRFD
jgi:hypothetical protein